MAFEHIAGSAGLVAALAIALAPNTSRAAPDEEALGKSAGYPICGSLIAPETKCLVGLVGRRDEVYPHRTVARPARARELKRAASEPAMRIGYGQYGGTIDDYLARNRTTGLLILKDDTILVLRAATGKPLADYLSEKIWKPMGAGSDASWMIDKGGFETGYAGINATLRGYGRFGMLLAQDGVLDGRRILPAGWVKAATTPPAPHFAPGASGAGLFGYGYQTWLLPGNDRQFVLRGRRNQAIFVDPQSKLVLVHTAAGADGMSADLLALWFSLTKRSGKAT